MVTLIQLRDAIALAGVVELQSLGRQFNAPISLLTALLDQLITLGKVEKIEAVAEGFSVSSCLGCFGCSQTRSCQRRCYYRSMT